MTGKRALFLLHLLFAADDLLGHELPYLLVGELFVHASAHDGLAHAPGVAAAGPYYGFGEGSSQAEIAYFNLAVRIYEYVRGLDVSVDHVRGVDVLHAAEQVVHDEDGVVLGQLGLLSEAEELS